MVQFSCEVWEEIFAHVPCVELLTVCRLVSKQWNEIISREKFIPNKKLYYKYCAKDDMSENFLYAECQRLDMTNLENCLQNLIKSILLGNHGKKNCENTLTRLKSHSRYQLACLNVEDVHSTYIQAHQPQSLLWGVVCVIVLVSHDAWEILRLIEILSYPTSEFSSKDVMEKMYYIAVYLLYFERKFNIPTRLHYNLFHAIHFFENCGSIPASIQRPLSQGTPSLSQSSRQSNPSIQRPLSQGTSSSSQSSKPINKMVLTHEQMRIVNHELKKTDTIKIVAFAGTGKTSTLVRFTEERPNMNFLILMFNKSVKDEAENKFPKYVQCRTVHQLARKYVQSMYPKKRIGEDIYPSTILQNNMLSPRKGMRKFQRETLALETLRRFMASKDEHVTMKHAPTRKRGRQIKDGSVKEVDLDDDERLLLAEDAEVLWKKISNPDYVKVKALPHDAYVKIWQLRKPEDLHELEGVDCIMIDEAQDISEAMLDVFDRQKSAARIIVGDPYQQIYQWRYAVNALDERISATHTYYLTHSFRFGPEIAFVANSCLKYFKEVRSRCLVGAKIRDSINLSSSIRLGEKEDAGKVCILSRTNLALFQKVVQIIGCDRTEITKRPLKISFVGGLEALGLDDLVDLINFKRGEYSKVANGFLKSFGTYSNFMEFVDAMGTCEWAAKLAIINWAGERTAQYVTMIKKHCVYILNYADVVFSTAHKSKGMEFDTVALLDDFEPKLVPSKELNEDDAAEQNLLYVAVTRAKRVLVINAACHFTLLTQGERHERFVGSQQTLDELPLPKCISCHDDLPGRCQTRIASLMTLPLYLMRIHTDSVTAVNPGIMCTLCAGFDRFTIPRYPSCYEDLPFPIVKPDVGHLAFRFLVGPLSTAERESAEIIYEERRQAMARGNDFVQAGAVPRPANRPLLIFHIDYAGDVKPAFPDDDDYFFDPAVSDAAMPKVALDDLFPNDDDLFRDVMM